MMRQETKRRRRSDLSEDYSIFKLAERLIRYGMPTTMITIELDLPRNIIQKIKKALHGKPGNGGSTIWTAASAITTVRMSVSASIFAKLWVQHLGHRDALYDMNTLVDVYERYLGILGAASQSQSITLTMAYMIARELRWSNPGDPLHITKCATCNMTYLHASQNDFMSKCPHCRMAARMMPTRAKNSVVDTLHG